MAILAVAAISRSLVVRNLVAASGGGDSMPNSGNEFLMINNGSGSPITVTAAIVQNVDGVLPAGKAIIVAAGAAALFGPFPPSQYNDSTSSVNFTYSGVTSLTIQAFSLNSARGT